MTVVEERRPRPTFLELAGASAGPTLPDGRSLAPLLHGIPRGVAPPALVEHHRTPTSAGRSPTPRREDWAQADDLRGAPHRDALYVEYADGSREYYDTHTDPQELHNVYRTLPAEQRRRLHGTLTRLAHCHGQVSCWRAGHLSGG